MEFRILLGRRSLDSRAAPPVLQAPRRLLHWSANATNITVSVPGLQPVPAASPTSARGAGTTSAPPMMRNQSPENLWGVVIIALSLVLVLSGIASCCTKLLRWRRQRVQELEHERHGARKDDEPLPGRLTTWEQLAPLNKSHRGVVRNLPKSDSSFDKKLSHPGSSEAAPAADKRSQPTQTTPPLPQQPPVPHEPLPEPTIQQPQHPAATPEAPQQQQGGVVQVAEPASPHQPPTTTPVPTGAAPLHLGTQQPAGLDQQPVSTAAAGQLQQQDAGDPPAIPQPQAEPAADTHPQPSTTAPAQPGPWQHDLVQQASPQQPPSSTQQAPSHPDTDPHQEPDQQQRQEQQDCEAPAPSAQPAECEVTVAPAEPPPPPTATATAAAAVSEQDDGLCPICLEDYCCSDVMRVLPCGHFFHQECVDVWMDTQAMVCPLCRTDLRAESPRKLRPRRRLPCAFCFQRRGAGGDTPPSRGASSHGGGAHGGAAGGQQGAGASAVDLLPV